MALCGPLSRCYLLGVGQQQDLCDGSWREDGVEGWEVGARGRLQLHLHHLRRTTQYVDHEQTINIT